MATGDDRGPLRVTGTWDFKWTPGTVIRFAIQDLPPGANHVELDAAIRQLRVVLESWAPKAGNRANISWEIMTYLLPPPRAALEARSSVLELTARPYLDYDVLVSFAALPVIIPETTELPSREVNFPRCELGSYARRTEYGVPTLYLGPHRGFLGSSADVTFATEADAARAWFSSPEGQFTMVHEVGHAFGLVHEQQNRRFMGPLPWRPMNEMVALARLRNQRVPPVGELEAFIAREITDRWPGDTRFSDWREPPRLGRGAAGAGSIDFDSVMAKPVFRCFLAGHHEGRLDCSSLRICPEEQAEFRRLRAPTESDRAQLVAMYGLSPQQVGAASQSTLEGTR